MTHEPPSQPEIPDERPELVFDPQEYRQFLEDCEWTDGQKDAFTEALWKIVLGFVDLGFGIHPIQQATKALAQDSPPMLASSEVPNIADIESGENIGHDALTEEEES